MFIIVIGTRASGKSTIKEYLIKKEGFKHVRLVYDGKPEEDNSSFRYKLDKFAGSVQSVVSRPTHGNEGTVYGEGPSTAPNYARSVVSEPDISEGQMKLEIPPVQAAPGSLLSQTSSTPAALVESDAVGELDGAIGFTDPKRLLEHVTRHWREHFVTEDITTRDVLEPFLKRPSVLLVSVDAPALTRFKRYQNRNKALTLEQFVADDDRVSFGADSDHITSSYLFASYHLCHINVINSFPTPEQLFSHLHSINLLHPDRLRPGWDTYFMKLASLASLRSNCMKRRVGAILVSKDHTIIATGYNGTPRGLPNCNQGGCKRCNEGGPSPTEGFEECLCIHAEENALLEAGRERVAGQGSILYCNTCPCLKCTIKIVQNGVTEVVYNLSYKMDASSARVFQTAGVKLRQYSLPG